MNDKKDKHFFRKHLNDMISKENEILKREEVNISSFMRDKKV